jgi:hypothetical protein
MADLFPLLGKYKRTEMKSWNDHKIILESCWDDASRNNAMMKFTVDNHTAIIRVPDLISSLMYHSGEDEARYMSDNLLSKETKKTVISYPFDAVLSRDHRKGELLHMTVQLDVPDAMLESKGVTRKNIVHEKSGGGDIISAPKGAGSLAGGSPKLT